MQIYNSVIQRVRNGDIQGAIEEYMTITGKPEQEAKKDIELVKENQKALSNPRYIKPKKENSMTLYRITRLERGNVLVNIENGISHQTEYPLVHIGFHSPDGFEYGYHGSGPADLAWSILAHFLGEASLTKKEQREGLFLSHKLHQAFKREVIAHLEMEINEHIITKQAVEDWVISRLGITHQQLKEYQSLREIYRTDTRYIEAMENREEEPTSEEEEQYEYRLKQISGYSKYFDTFQLELIPE